MGGFCPHRPVDLASLFLFIIQGVLFEEEKWELKRESPVFSQ